MPKYDAHDPELQQKVGKWVLTGLGVGALLLLAQCLRGSPDERLMKCYLQQMEGQGEHMSDVAERYCREKHNMQIK